MKKRLMLIMFLGLWHNIYAQSKVTLQQYYYRGQQMPFNFMPIVSYQAETKWYLESRYNYEAKNAASLYIGKAFEGTAPFSYSVTPLVGLVLGDFNGGSAGANISFDYKRLSFSSQAQYTFSVEDKTNNYSYSWSDLTFRANKWLSAGVSLQQTNIYQTTGKFEKGLIIKPQYKKFTFPLYIFNPTSNERYFVLGVNFEMEVKN